VSGAFVGLLAGPVLALFFSFGRIGPPGFIWWEGKGGETFQTPLGQTVLVIISVVGAIAGSLCGWAFDLWYRPGIAAGKLKSDAPSAHLWDRELDG
jgi:hypothetical protein